MDYATAKANPDGDNAMNASGETSIESAENTIKIICAYNVNIDAVLDLENLKKLDKWNEKMSDFIKSVNSNETYSEPRKSIKSWEDLIYSLLYSMENGIGPEILIVKRSEKLSEEFAKQIEDSFPWRYRLGGNAGIIANLLADNDVQPVLNAPFFEESRLNKEEELNQWVRVPVDGKLLEPKEAAEKQKIDPREVPVHFVFQFNKNDKICLLGRKKPIKAIKEDRFSATYDIVNTKLETSSGFDTYCLNNIQDFEGAIISGFHLVPPGQYKNIIRKKIDQIKTWKEANPGIYIHVEMGSFQSSDIAKYFLSLLSEIPVDSLGLNEDELKTAKESLSEKRGDKKSTQEKDDSEKTLEKVLQDSDRILRDLERLHEQLRIFRVAVHTEYYTLSIMKVGRLTLEEELNSLRIGTRAAAALMATGSAKGNPPEEYRAWGLEVKKKFCQEWVRKDCVDNWASVQKDGKIICLMPSLDVKEPLIKVGLGDTATAAIFLEEIKAIKKNRI